MLDRGGVSHRARGLVGLATAGWLLPALALASDSGPGFRSDLGIVGGVLHFLGAYPFVLLFGTLNVAGAYSGGYVSILLAIGLVASLLPPLAAWVIGRTLLDLNPAILMGMICGARHSTPALRAAQEECGSAIPAVGYPVAYAISSVLVLLVGYLALFL